MKQRILLFLLFLGPWDAYSQGMIFDEETYSRIPLFNLADQDETGVKEKRIQVPPARDLRPFMPYITDQKDLSTCVSISTLYYAAGIRQAYLQQKTDSKHISDNYALAPLYNLRKNNLGCEQNLRLDAMLNELLEKGGIPYKFYPYDECSQLPLPESEVFIRAKDPQRLCGGYSEKNGKKIHIPCDKATGTIKVALANGFPVVAGIPVDKLREYKPGISRLYKPEKSERKEYHAVTIVGYHEDEFIVANSWGKNWGDNGYFHIRQTDMDKILVGAFTFGLDVTGLNVQANKLTKGVGVVCTMANSTNRIQPVKYTEKGVYVTEENYKPGDSFYGFIRTLNSEMFVTIISQDADNFKVEKHYPRPEDEAGVTLLPAEGSPVIFPHPDYPLEITGGRKDYLIILAGKRDISSDLPRIMRDLELFSDNSLPVSSRLEKVLGERMIASKDISYSLKEGGIKAELKNLETVGDILPVIIEINHSAK